MNLTEIKSRIRDNLSQILAIVVKNVKLASRFKLSLILGFVSPLLTFILPLIIFGQLFSFNSNFGPWDETNFVVFIILGYELTILFGIEGRFSQNFQIEKFWKTLPGIIIAPFKRINLLLGIFFTHLVLISFVFTFFLVICFIYYPIHFATLVLILCLFFMIALIFGGLGLVAAILYISKENLIPIYRLGTSMLFIFSCVSLPFDFFPDYFQFFVSLNPLYYIIDITRLVWVENDIIFSLLNHPIHWTIIFVFTPLSPIVGISIFNYIFKKFGIQGY